jgi:hypothetical protein
MGCHRHCQLVVAAADTRCRFPLTSRCRPTHRVKRQQTDSGGVAEVTVAQRRSRRRASAGGISWGCGGRRPLSRPSRRGRSCQRGDERR